MARKKRAKKKSPGKSAKPVGRLARKKAKLAAKRRAVARPSAHRTRWFDEGTEAVLIDAYARQLQSFVDVTADGRVGAAEVDRQEKRVVTLMKKVEPRLDDLLHADITELLCELTALGLMQALHKEHLSAAQQPGKEMTQTGEQGA